MKRHIIIPILLLTLGFVAVSCSNDDLDKTSIITVNGNVPRTELDEWLDANFLYPYNIQFNYRYVDNETDMNYFNVPPTYENVIKLAHIVKYTCVESYNEVAGVDFTRQYFPKMFYLTGTWEFLNNGTIILGTAEGGKKIFLAGVNYLGDLLEGKPNSGTFYFDEGTDIQLNLNKYYLKTIHHEFTHILNQTKNYSEEYQQITGAGYVNDSWSDFPYNGREENSADSTYYYLKHGFISAYSQKEHREDFAEILSEYVTNSPEQWEVWMKQAGPEGRSLIEQKLDIVKDYMLTQWNINLDQLRETVLRREHDVVKGVIDLDDMTVK